MASRGGRSPANIAKHLKGISFPAKQTDLVKHAREQKAEPEVIKVLEICRTATMATWRT